MKDDRFKRIGDYSFDRYIFKAYIILIFLFLLFVAWDYSFDLDYFECNTLSHNLSNLFEPSNTEDYCKNPFFRPTSWKNQEALPPGEYGKNTQPVIDTTWWLSGGLFLVAIVTNHFVHNRNKKLRVKLDDDFDD